MRENREYYFLLLFWLETTNNKLKTFIAFILSQLLFNRLQVCDVTTRWRLSLSLPASRGPPLSLPLSTHTRFPTCVLLSKSGTAPQEYGAFAETALDSDVFTSSFTYIQIDFSTLLINQFTHLKPKPGGREG